MPQAPELSIVIPSHNRQEVLRRLLESLSRQTLPADSFEVIVANDASTDGTAEMLDTLETPYRLRHLNLTHRGEWGASNAGIEAATGRICVLIDDDVVAAPQMLAEHAAAHQGDPGIVGLGRLFQEPPPGSDWYTRENARHWNQRFEQLANRPAKWTDCFSGNTSIPREALLAIGGFTTDPLADGDAELAWRLVNYGLRPVYLPDAAGQHFDHKKRDKLIRDARRHGKAAVRWIKRDPAMMPALLGWFGSATRREIIQRRIALTLRPKGELLARLGPLLPGSGRREYWFHFVFRYTFWRSVRENVSRSEWVALTHGVPVLMYHAFSDSGEQDRYIVSKRSFAKQMRLLRLLRYRTISFEELARTVREHRLPPRRSVVITIDDGYVDNLEIAYPVLRRHNLKATIFLISDRLGKANDWATGATKGRPLLNEEQIARLREGPIQLGAHTRTHPRLTEIPDEQVGEEIEGSRAELEQRLGVPINVFAYPFGRYDQRAVDAVKSGGLLGAGTTEPRLVAPSDDPALFPRIEIEGSDTTAVFLAKLWFGVQ